MLVLVLGMLPSAFVGVSSPLHSALTALSWTPPMKRKPNTAQNITKPRGTSGGGAPHFFLVEGICIQQIA